MYFVWILYWQRTIWNHFSSGLQLFRWILCYSFVNKSITLKTWSQNKSFIETLNIHFLSGTSQVPMKQTCSSFENLRILQMWFIDTQNKNSWPLSTFLPFLSYCRFSVLNSITKKIIVDFSICSSLTTHIFAENLATLEQHEYVISVKLSPLEQEKIWKLLLSSLIFRWLGHF